MKSSCFLRQLDGFLGGSAFSVVDELCDFGLMGLSTGMSVPSALCLLESKIFLFLLDDF